MKNTQQHNGLIVRTKERRGLIEIQAMLADEPKVFAFLRVRSVAEVEKFNAFLGEIAGASL